MTVFYNRDAESVWDELGRTCLFTCVWLCASNCVHYKDLHKTLELYITEDEILSLSITTNQREMNIPQKNDFTFFKY